MSTKSFLKHTYTSSFRLGLLRQIKVSLFLKTATTNPAKQLHSCGAHSENLIEKGRSKKQFFLPGDWTCSSCYNHNFRYRNSCKSCNKPKTENDLIKDGAHSKLMLGDWLCVKCDFHNYAYRKTCLKCNEEVNSESFSKAKEAMTRKGDWDCPNCKTFNFGFRTVCVKCKLDQPEELNTRSDFNNNSCNAQPQPFSASDNASLSDTIETNFLGSEHNIAVSSLENIESNFSKEGELDIDSQMGSIESNSDTEPINLDLPSTESDVIEFSPNQSKKDV